MYATLQDFKNRLGSSVAPPGVYEQVTDRVSQKVANDAVGQAFIDEADGFVNAMLAQKFKVPIDVSSEPLTANFLRKCVLDIACYNAYSGSRKEIPKAIVDAYTETRNLLQKIHDGEAIPPSSAPLPGTTAALVIPDAVGWTPLLTEEGSSGLL